VQRTKSNRSYYLRLEGRRFIQYKDLFPLFILVIAYFIIFKYVPMYGVTLAFKKFNLRKGILASPWVGLKWFKQVFSTPSFWEVMRNTVTISLLRIAFGFPAPILLALLLNEVREGPFRKTVQTISYLPHFLSWIILAGLFTQLLSPSNGPINHIIKMFGGEPIYFLADNKWFRWVMVISDVWKGMGWGSIVYLATISGIDTELYEAAECDGATRAQKIFKITLPLMKPTIVILLIMNCGSLLNAGFDQIFNFYNNAVMETADIIDTYVYRTGIGEMKYSQSTAVGLFKNVIGFILVTGTNWVANRLGEGGIW